MRAVHHQHLTARTLVRKVDVVDVDQMVLGCLVALLDVEVRDEFEGAEVVVVELVGKDGALEGRLVDLELAGTALAQQGLCSYLVVQVDLLDVVLDQNCEGLAHFLCVGTAAVAHVRSYAEAALFSEPGVDGRVQVERDAGISLNEQHVGLRLDWH